MKLLMGIIAILVVLLAAFVLFAPPIPQQENTDQNLVIQNNSCEEYGDGGFVAEFVGGPLESLNDLVDRVDAIIVAEVIDCGPNPRSLNAKSQSVDFNFSVEQVLKGDIATSTIPVKIWVDVSSEGVAHTEYRTPKLTAGQRVVLFLDKKNKTYHMYRGGNTIAIGKESDTFAFSRESELSIPYTFHISEIESN